MSQFKVSEESNFVIRVKTQKISRLRRFFSCFYCLNRKLCKECNMRISSNNDFCKIHMICSVCSKNSQVTQNEELYINGSCNCKYFIKSIDEISTSRSNYNKNEKIASVDNSDPKQPKSIITNPKNPGIVNSYSREYEEERSYLNNNRFVETKESKNSFSNDHHIKPESGEFDIDSKSLSDINCSSYENFSSICNCLKCFKPNEVFGFLCNHNICKSCLTLHCAEIIHNFKLEYENIDFSKFEITFYCPVEGCKGRNNVPSIMIINNMRLMLKDEEFRKINEKFLFFEEDWIENWIPYFDGLNLRFLN